MKKLEKVLRAATRWLPTLRELNYKERLRKLNVPKLKGREIRENMITMYKSMADKLKLDVYIEDYLLEETQHREDTDEASEKRK